MTLMHPMRACQRMRHYVCSASAKALFMEAISCAAPGTTASLLITAVPCFILSIAYLEGQWISTESRKMMHELQESEDFLHIAK